MGKLVHKKTASRLRFERESRKLSKLASRVGWFESAKYEDGTPVAYVAAIQEFRDGGSRSFMRTTEAQRGEEWKKLMGEGAAMAMRGELTVEDVLKGVAQQAEGDILQTLSNIFTPPLSPITMVLRLWRRQGRKITGKTVGEAAAALKGPNPPDYSGVSDKPLNDSDHMIATLTSEVGSK